MAFYRCKMCGGDLEQTESSICICSYCGTKQTIPFTESEKITNLFNRANQMRMVNRFDEAKKIYEEILIEDINNAEAHWGIVLCKYGIEYVDDNFGNKIPTCHRTVLSSITSDIDYIETIKCSNNDAKTIYEQEAQKISDIQKGIIEQSKFSDDFDVFICYKETDDNGERTEDSVIAQDLYYLLEKNGYKTFFARKTLENKLGSEYEPIIYSALKTSEVMVVLGTRPEYIKSTWLRNEWNRFLDFSDSENKLLIPAYRGFSPYELPSEFSALQSLDIGRIGFMQDLLDAIDKILKKEQINKVVTPTVSNSLSDVSLVERAYIYLEDSEWQKAVDYCERALDINPKNSNAYFCMFLASQTCDSFDKLVSNIMSSNTGFERTYHFEKAEKYADSKILEKINKLEYTEKNLVYQNALEKANAGDLLAAIKDLKTILQFKDSASLIEQFERRLQEEKKIKLLASELDLSYKSKLNKLKTLETNYSNTKSEIEKYNSLLLKSSSNINIKKMKRMMALSIIMLIMKFQLLLMFICSIALDNEDLPFLTAIFSILVLVVHLIFIVCNMLFNKKIMLKNRIKNVVLLTIIAPLISSIITIKDLIPVTKGVNPVALKMNEWTNNRNINISCMKKQEEEIVLLQREIEAIKEQINGLK